MSEKDINERLTNSNQENSLSTDYAVALGYEPDKDKAPKVLAKGQGHVAQKIIQIAIDEGIEIRKDADLLQILKAVDIDSEIPIEAFSAVAEIISYIYQQNGKEIKQRLSQFFHHTNEKSIGFGCERR